MANEIIIKDFPKICRLCLSFENILPILSIDVLQTFINITNMEIDREDDLPKNICKACLKQLETISYFINTCKNSYSVLLSVISKQHLEIFSIDEENEIKSAKGTNIDKPQNYELTGSTSDDSGAVSNKIEVTEIFTPINTKKVSSNKKNIKGNRADETLPFLCNFCGKNFSTKNGFDRHILSHNGVKPFECESCGKCFVTKDTLKKHMVMHTGTRAYKCKICEKCFTQSSHLSYHIKRHTGEKPYKCNFCAKGFLSRYHLERHKVIHSGMKPFGCDQCDKQFITSSSLKDHISDHNKKKELRELNTKKYLCTTCGKCFTAVGTLNVHIRIHTGENPFTCSYCNRGYNNSSSLKRHIMRKHTGEKPYVCLICNKGYHDSTNLKRHMKRTHPEVKGQVQI